MKRLATLDASWLAVESDDTPMHVGNLQIFSLPENAAPTFTGDLVKSMKQAGNVEFPWGCKLVWPSFLGRVLAPTWKHDKHIDLDYHVRHSALPKPGGERELGVLVSRLHSNPLDLSRPLWECHMIEGLEHNRFALYTKMHHCMIDGISGVRLMQRVLSKSPDERDIIVRIRNENLNHLNGTSIQTFNRDMFPYLFLGRISLLRLRAGQNHSTQQEEGLASDTLKHGLWRRYLARQPAHFSLTVNDQFELESWLRMQLPHPYGAQLKFYPL